MLYHWWLLVCLAIFLIGVTKSGFGSGVGLMIVPLTAIAMGHIPERGAEAALGLLLPLLIFGDFFALFQYRRLFVGGEEGEGMGERGNGGTGERHRGRLGESAKRRSGDAGATGAALTIENRESGIGNPPASAFSIVRLLLPGTALGVVLGGLLLWWFHQQQALVSALMRIEIGCESILLVGLHWWRLYKGEQARLVPEPLRSWGTGAFAGASSTLAHAAGPIIAMYMLPLHLPRQLFVGTCAAYFFLLNTAKLPAYVVSGQFAKAEFSFTIKFLPLVVAGALFGLWVNKHLSDKLFTRIVYILTFAMGWYILVDGTMMMLR